VKQITHRGKVALDTIPDWSPDGRWIAFQRQVEGKATAIFKVRSDGTHLTRLSTDPNVNEEFPAWSPSGKRIVFTRFDDATGVVAVFVMRADGTQVRQVTPSRFGGVAGQFSPNGARLVFVGGEQGTSKAAIFTIRLDGTGAHRLTPWQMHAAGADWSPNGQWIKFRSHSGQDRTSNLYLIHPDGTGLVLVTHTFRGFPQWGGSSFSPDGTMITAAHNTAQEGTGSISHVWVMDLDGSNLRKVTRSAKFDSAPDWGPRHA
jgi:Tol biopolymer transport system component